MLNFLKFHDSMTERTSYVSMRRVIQPARKARIERVPGGLRVLIPGSLGWALIVGHALMLLVALSFTKDELFGFFHVQPDWGTLLSAILFGVPELLGFALLLWQLAGAEVISIDGEWIIQRIQLLGLRWSRRFLLQNVRDLAVFSVRGQYPGTDWSPELLQTSIMFHCAGKAYKFGLGIDYNAARRVVDSIREAYPMVGREA
jgi:hypothetical protein